MERNGRVVSKTVEHVTGANLRSIIVNNVDKSSFLMTDDFPAYKGRYNDFSSHETINHGKKEYVRGNVHTNTVEGYFSLLKRGIIGVYHHVDEQHLDRYLSEFDFRYSNRHVDDEDRTIIALMGIEGKRLMYRDSSAAD